MNRKAEARWEGDLKAGKGHIKLESGAFQGPYSFGARFESAPGTNPEELLGAAHAGCFSMALSLALSSAGHIPTSIDTTATVHLEKGEKGFSITGIDLVTKAVVPGLSNEAFQQAAEATKTNCIISKALASVPMRLEAHLNNA